MRIVVVGGFAPSLINFRRELLEALVAAGHEVFAVASEDDPAIDAELTKLGVNYQPIALTRTGGCGCRRQNPGHSGDKGRQL